MGALFKAHSMDTETVEMGGSYLIHCMKYISAREFKRTGPLLHKISFFVMTQMQM